MVTYRYRTAVRAAKAAGTPAFALGILAADGLFALGFVLYAVALPLGVAGAACLVARRK